MAGKGAEGAYQVRGDHRDDPSDTDSGQVSGQHLIVTTGGLDVDDRVELGGSDHPSDDTGDETSDRPGDAAPLVRLRPGGADGDGDDCTPEENTHEGLVNCQFNVMQRTDRCGLHRAIPWRLRCRRR